MDRGDGRRWVDRGDEWIEIMRMKRWVDSGDVRRKR